MSTGAAAGLATMVRLDPRSCDQIWIVASGCVTLPLVFTLAPVGAIDVGWIGKVAGLEAALIVAAIVTLVGAWIQFASPIRAEW